jgi:hypothetical protein
VIVFVGMVLFTVTAFCGTEESPSTSRFDGEVFFFFFFLGLRPPLLLGPAMAEIVCDCC